MLRKILKPFSIHEFENKVDFYSEYKIQKSLLRLIKLSKVVSASALVDLLPPPPLLTIFEIQSTSK